MCLRFWTVDHSTCSPNPPISLGPTRSLAPDMWLQAHPQEASFLGGGAPSLLHQCCPVVIPRGKPHRLGKKEAKKVA